MTKRRIGLFIIAALVCFSVFSVSKSVMESAKQGGEAKETGSLGEYWAEGSELAADLSGYIAAVTDEASADYIPPEDRIAVFDLDGTLMCETYPFCFEYMFFADYALNSGSDTVTEETRAVAQEIVDAIVREIGKQPVLAFGNSSGDLAMEIYTISGNRYRSAAFMVLADDEEREYGDAAGAQKKRASYEEQGIGIISMKDDFMTIYGDEVQKTGFSE